MAAADDNAPHVLVVDDDERLRDLLKRYLGEHGFRVTLAADAAAAKRRLDMFAFDAAVLDVMMPGQDGLSLTAELRTHTALPILLLTAMAEPADRIAGLEHGADDYLAKPFEPRELLLRLQSILRRVPATNAAAAEDAVVFGAFRFATAAGRLTRDGAPVSLTTGELALLGALAANAGAAVDREALSRQLAGGNPRAVDVQITRLRRKIEPDTRHPRFIETVRGAGYRLVVDAV